MRQVIVVLHGDNGHDLLRSRQLIDGDIREPDMANLPLLPHLRELTDGDFEGNPGIRAMELIQVDVVEAQAAQTAL